MADIYDPKIGSVIDARHPIDPKKCKARVTQDSWHSGQCSRKATRDGWCKQHHPEAEAERDAVAKAKYEAASRKLAMGFYGERMMAALIKIRDGDNDPRTTAANALEGISYAATQGGE